MMRRSALSALVIAMMVSTAVFAVAATSGDALASKGKAGTTSTVYISSSTTVCVGVFCYAVGPSVVTTTSITDTTTTTTSTDTVNTTSTATTTTMMTTTVTVTQIGSTTETTTTTQTAVTTYTVTSTIPVTTTTTGTSTETSTLSSTSTYSTITTTTVLTTLNESTTTTETATVTTGAATSTTTSAASTSSTTFSGGGGGGGCVLAGTLITLSNGSQVPVESLQVGDSVLSYNAQTGQLVASSVSGNGASQVSQVLDVNNGALYISGLNDQPMYVRMSNGTRGAVLLSHLRTGMDVFVPQAGAWVPVASLTWIAGSFTVYDLRVSSPTASNYVANGMLVNVKI